MKRAFALLAALLLVTGCGGGGQSAAPTTGGASAKIVNGTITLSIPTRGSSAQMRYPQFVSPNASSVTIVLNGGTAQLFDVSSGSTLCTTSAGTRTCTLTVGAPAGSDTFAFTIFAGANGTGTVLSTATSSTTVTAGSPFTLSVALNAAIGTVVATIPTTGGTQGNCVDQDASQSTGITEGCAGNSGTVNVNAFDPSGAPITGTAPYATPITFAASDPSVTVAPAQVTAPGGTISVTYSGAAFAAATTTSITISATAGGQVVATAPILTTRQYLYVANSNAQPGTTPTGGGNIEVFPFGANGTATPVRVLSGTNTSLSNPVSVKEDSLGNLYVLDNGPYTTHSNPVILVFGVGSTGNAPTLRQITQIAGVTGNDACEDMIFDPTGQYLFVTCDDAQIHVFSVLANTTATSAQVALLHSTSFVTPIGETFDALGNLYVADPGSNDIFYFQHPISTSGSSALTPTFAMSGGAGPWPGNVAPLGVKIDNAGTLFASVVYFNSTGGPPDANNEIAMWNTSSIPCNNCAPTATLGGTPLSTHLPTGGAFDSMGNLYVSNPLTNQVTVFARSVIASAGSPTLNPAVLHTINTGSSPGAPGGLVIGP